MSHFAKVENGVITQVIVVEKEVLDSGVFGDPNTWIQTSYNTRGGIYYIPNTDTPDPDQTKALRKNYAGIGYTYDLVRDAFIPPIPEPIENNTWILDENTCNWVLQSSQ